MNRTKHHKPHAFQRAVGWCETVCNLCCYPLRAVYRKLLKRVSITGFPVIENLIADSDIKDRTERSPQAANKVVSRKFQTFVFRCMKSTLEDGVFFIAASVSYNIALLSRENGGILMNGLVIVLIGIVALGAGYLLYGRWLAKNGGLIQKQKHRPTPKKTDRIMCHLPSSPYFRTSFHRLQVPVLSQVLSSLPYSAGYRFFCG